MFRHWRNLRIFSKTVDSAKSDRPAVASLIGFPCLLFYGIAVLLTAAVFQIAEVVAIDIIRWEEFVDGELDATEQFAGIVVRGTYALFVRHAEVDNRHSSYFKKP